MSGILDKYKDLRPLFGHTARVHDMLREMSSMSQSEADLHNAGSPYAGSAFIRDTTNPEPAILEVILPTGGDYAPLATLFHPHSLFNSRDSYREGRVELLDCLYDLKEATLAGLVLKECPVRKVPVNVRDLGVVQLIELIQSAVNGWTESACGVPH